MAFSFNDVPRIKNLKQSNGVDKRKEIARCYMIIKNQNKLSDNVRKALEKYLTNRLKTLSNINLSSKLLEENIKELLEYCCNKNYDSITVLDVINNELQILQQIRWCIKHGNTKRLVWIEDEHLDTMRFKDSKSMGNVSVSTMLDEDDLLGYFNII